MMGAAHAAWAVSKRVGNTNPLKATVRSIAARKQRPNFPAGHWRDIIGGRYVDLDKLREDACTLTCYGEVRPLRTWRWGQSCTTRSVELGQDEDGRRFQYVGRRLGTILRRCYLCLPNA